MPRHGGNFEGNYKLALIFYVLMCKCKSDGSCFADMPFQLVPVLEVDDNAKLCGQVNIARFIGEKYSEYFLNCFTCN